MINNQLTLLRDIKTVDQLIIKLVQLGYQRANDFEEEDNEWGDINKYCVNRDEEMPLDGITQGEININPKTWLNKENEKDEPFVDFSTHVFFDPDDKLFMWSFCYVEMGETWDIDINSVYIEELDEKLAEFAKVADKKLEERQEEILVKRIIRKLNSQKEWGNDE